MLMTGTAPGAVWIEKQLPVISGKFTGPNYMIDTQNGNRWGVMQPLDNAEKALQSIIAPIPEIPCAEKPAKKLDNLPGIGEIYMPGKPSLFQSIRRAVMAWL